MIWRAGSTLAPNLWTTSPSTSTRPAPISSSQRRRLPSPAAARIFCNRMPPAAVVCPAARSASGLLTFDFLDVVRQEGRELRQLLQRGQAQTLEEIAGRAIKDGPGLRLGSRLFGQAAQHECADHAIAVDPAHRRHAGTA